MKDLNGKMDEAAVGTQKPGRTHFQVSHKYNKYFGHNEVKDGETVTFQPRICPDCFKEFKGDYPILDDERGLAHCICCGKGYPFKEEKATVTKNKYKSAERFLKRHCR